LDGREKISGEFVVAVAMAPKCFRAGWRRAKAQGPKSGNPIGRLKVEAATEIAIRTALAKGDLVCARLPVRLVSVLGRFSASPPRQYKITEPL
jgi:hypothetical protein